MTTIGKYRHLSRTSTDHGQLVVLAIDHRDHLRIPLGEHAGSEVSDAQVTAFKQQVIGALLPEASAVLVDPEYGIGPGIVEHTVPGGRGLLAPLEITNYGIHPTEQDVILIPGWSVAKIKRMGLDGVKMLLFYNPEAEDTADKQDLTRNIVDECALHDIPLYLEPIPYSLDPSHTLTNAERLDIILESARVFSGLGVDILKMPFPVDAKQSQDEDEWREACEKMDAACGVPWTLLSAGVDYDTFLRQVKVASAAGSSGVMVGRAVWAEAVELSGAERERFINETAKARMRELAEVCDANGTSWQERTPAPNVEQGWYESY
jgi:tagatose 1,6-diphosphate aldolase